MKKAEKTEVKLMIEFYEVLKKLDEFSLEGLEDLDNNKSVKNLKPLLIKKLTEIYILTNKLKQIWLDLKEKEASKKSK